MGAEYFIFAAINRPMMRLLRDSSIFVFQRLKHIGDFNLVLCGSSSIVSHPVTAFFSEPCPSSLSHHFHTRP